MNYKNKKIITLLLSIFIINTVSCTTNCTTFFTSQAYAPRNCSNKVRFTETAALKKGTGSNTTTLIKIPKGTILTAKMETPAWYKFTYKSKTGWVLKKSTTPVAVGTSCSTKIKTTSNLNLREDTSTDTASLIVIPKGTNLTATAYTPSWYKVTYKSKTGWIYRTHTTGGTIAKTVGDPCSDVIKTTSNLNVRAEASSQTDLLITIPKGTVVETSRQTTSWYKVTYKSKTGWVHKNYTSVVSSTASKPKTPTENVKSYALTGYTGKTLSEVNLRYSDSASSESLGLVPKGKNVSLVRDSILTNWYLIEYTNDKKQKVKGWVSKQYVEVLTPKKATSAPVYKPSTVKPNPAKDVFDTSKPQPSKSDVLSLINKHAKNLGVNASLFKAVVETESSFNNQCISPKGAVGLIQLMPETAREMGLTVNSNVDMRWDPDKNIEAGMKYINKYYHQLIREYGSNGSTNDWNRALAAYNAGPANVRKYKGAIPPFEETQNYVKKINERKGKY